MNMLGSRDFIRSSDRGHSAGPSLSQEAMSDHDSLSFRRLGLLGSWNGSLYPEAILIMRRHKVDGSGDFDQ